MNPIPSDVSTFSSAQLEMFSVAVRPGMGVVPACDLREVKTYFDAGRDGIFYTINLKQ